MKHSVACGHLSFSTQLPKALLQARRDPQFQEYLAKTELQDLSIGKRGEHFEAAFAAEAAELRKLNR